MIYQEKMKKRLEDLLEESMRYADKHYGDRIVSGRYCGLMADYLKDHGVIASQAEVQDTRYNECCRKQSGWISMEERPPEIGKSVLVYRKGCLQEMMVQYYRKNGVFLVGNVTHWMPLPEPPKVET